MEKEYSDEWHNLGKEIVVLVAILFHVYRQNLEENIDTDYY